MSVHADLAAAWHRNFVALAKSLAGDVASMHATIDHLAGKYDAHVAAIANIEKKVAALEAQPGASAVNFVPLKTAVADAMAVGAETEGVVKAVGEVVKAK